MVPALLPARSNSPLASDPSYRYQCRGRLHKEFGLSELPNCNSLMKSVRVNMLLTKISYLNDVGGVKDKIAVHVIGYIGRE